MQLNCEHGTVCLTFIFVVNHKLIAKAARVFWLIGIKPNEPVSQVAKLIGLNSISQDKRLLLISALNLANFIKFIFCFTTLLSA